MADSYWNFEKSDRYREISDAGERVARLGRLRWLMRQLDRNFALDGPGELRDLRDEALYVAGATTPQRFQLAAESLDVAELGTLFLDARGALNALWGEGVVQPWLLPDQYRLALTVSEWASPTGKKPGKKDRGYMVPGRLELVFSPVELTLRGAFLGEVLKELQTPAALLIRRCAWCGAFFVRIKSQRFHTPKCTQAAMNAAKRGRRQRAPFVPDAPHPKKRGR